MQKAIRCKTVFVILSTATACLAGCSSSEDQPAKESSAPASKCYSVEVNEQDGKTACSSSICSAGQWCVDILCREGCTHISNCPKGQFCDLSNPTQIHDKNVGTCRTPTSAQEIQCSKDAGTGNPSQCKDVRGVYSVTLDTAASSSACRKEFPSSLECTITQDGCTMAFACNPDPGFDRANLDANQRATFSAPGPAGSTGECSAQFHLDGGRASLDWECTFTAPAGSATCKGNGSGRGS